MAQSKVFFSGLNELRAIAALSVLFHHVELYNQRLKVTSLFDFPYVNTFISDLGKNGVYLFFVLSGFLITYLLLEEKASTGSIHVVQFYKRRIVRIWPLYFIIVLVGFAILPLLHNWLPVFFEGQTFYNQKIDDLYYGKNLLLFLVFFSNVALMIFSPVAGASQSWSVSVEEQFYVIWPWIVKFFSNVLIPVLIAIVIVVGLLNHYVEWFGHPAIRAFITTFNIDFMAIGGLCAVLYRKHPAIFSTFAKNHFFFAIVVASVALHLFTKLSHVTTAISFALLIVCFIERQVKNKPLDTLGKWSYGIYMYHPAMMYIAFSIVDQLNLNSLIGDRILEYVLVVGLTIGVSFLSYRYIELYFLKLKHKFSPVISGNI